MRVEKEKIQFRDASQVASWVNRHPAVAIWVRERTQPGTIGPFRSWSSWAGRSEHEDSPWIDDERMYELRSRICEQVASPQGVLRIVGLSGVGKSRLVIEALRDSGKEPLRNIALCADESEADATAIHSVVQTWAETGTRALVIVDRCPPRSHKVLASSIARSGSSLSLVTIDNELASGTGDEPVFEVSKAQDSVIEALIDRARGRSIEDTRRLVRFSSGLPGIAIRLARAWAESRPVAHATDEDFVEAYVLGRLQHERELVLRSAMLLATYGMADLTAGPGCDLDTIATRGRNLERRDLRAAVQTLLDRRVCQRRGNCAVFHPRPVALRLSERQWREWEPADWDEVLASDTATHLSIRAAQQLSLLNTTTISMEVVAHVCRVDGPFEGSEAISVEGHAEVLSALAQIDSMAVAEQIERSLADTPDLSTIEGLARRHLVWALEKIAFCKHTFEIGARLLLRLAVAENEPQIGNNATAQFASLFTVLAGATEADGTMRFAMLDEASETDDPSRCSVIVEALIAGSETRSAFRIVGAETHGSRPALVEWRPTTRGEMNDYISGCVTRLAPICLKNRSSWCCSSEGSLGTSCVR